MPARGYRWTGTALKALFGTPIQPPTPDPPTVETFVHGVTVPSEKTNGVGILAPAPTRTKSAQTYIASNDEIIDGWIITGTIDCRGKSNVVIRNCDIRIAYSASTTIRYGVLADSKSSNILIEFSDIHSSTGYPSSIGLATENIKSHRNNLYDIQDAYRVSTATGSVDFEILDDYAHDLIITTPDPNINRTATDNKTHSDLIQWEGGFGLKVTGSCLAATKSHFSNVDKTSRASGSSWWRPDSGGTVQTQSNTCIIVTPNVSACSGLTFEDNFCFGAETAVHLGASTITSTLTGSVKRNKFDRNQRNGPSAVIFIKAAATGVSTAENRYMDNGALVTVNRNG